MKVLFIGDVYMEKGREALAEFLPSIKQEYKPHIIIVNAENIANGNGLTEPIYKDLMKMGVHAITLGNHAFSKKDSLEVLGHNNVCRPANYGKGTLGNEYVTINYNGTYLTVINMLGRVFMGDPLDNPFTRMDELLNEITSDYIFLDFHAEATSEKYALANYLDGRIHAMVGTHTHVPTADNLRFPKGLLYITDVGMTGVKYSIIGGDISQGIRKFVSGVSERTLPEKNGPLQFNAALIDFDRQTIERINR